MRTIIKKYRLELVQETSKKYSSDLRAITCVDYAAQAFGDLFNLKNQAEEVMALLCLDTKNKIIGAFEVSRGTVNSSEAHPREILKRALLLNSARIMLGHNHPSGELTPSNADNFFTERMVQACELVGIELLDHVIVANDNAEYYSYKREAII